MKWKKTGKWENKEGINIPQRDRLICRARDVCEVELCFCWVCGRDAPCL